MLQKIINKVISQKKLPEVAEIGILIPIRKHDEEPKLYEIYRSLMLLPLIRKITAVIILNRVSEAAMKRLPKKQTAYQPQRGTTEKVLAVEILYEKLLVTEDVHVPTKLIDMSIHLTLCVETCSKKNVNISWTNPFHSLRALTGPHWCKSERLRTLQ